MEEVDWVRPDPSLIWYWPQTSTSLLLRHENLGTACPTCSWHIPGTGCIRGQHSFAHKSSTASSSSALEVVPGARSRTPVAHPRAPVDGSSQSIMTNTSSHAAQRTHATQTAHININSSSTFALATNSGCVLLAGGIRHECCGASANTTTTNHTIQTPETSTAVSGKHAFVSGTLSSSS